MRKLLSVCLVASTAFAGDRLLGVLLVTDGGTVNNATTGYGSAGCSRQQDIMGAGACAQAFPIGTSALLSIQCKDQAAVFAANSSTVDAGTGVKLAADQFLTTSTGSSAITVWGLNPDGGSINTHGLPNGMPDGGSYTGGVVSIAPIAGATRAECNVNERAGNE